MKDESDFIKGPKSKTYTSNILGIVIDESGKAIENASVHFEDQITQTDKNGVYQFKNVEISSQHSFINITKQGYFDGNRAFTVNRKSSIQLKNVLVEKVFDKSFDASAGGLIAKSNITLSFPQNAIVVESSNELYSGQVHIALKYLDPESASILDEMPGNLSGINSAEDLVVLTTFGMALIEMQGSNGQTLQIASGKKVKMSNKLTASMLLKAPSSIPLWYFDIKSGYWIEEGEAGLEKDTYVGEISHFSSWNYDIQDPSVLLSGRVVDFAGNNLSGIFIEIYEEGVLFASFYGNPDGTFSGRVKKGHSLTLVVKSGQLAGGCPDDILYQIDLGPLNTDLELNDLIVNLGTLNNYKLSGKAFNCEGIPVNNGFVKIISTAPGNQTWFFPIINGAFEGRLVSCILTANYNYIVFDTDANIENDSKLITLNGDIDLGDITVCGHIIDFVSIHCFYLDLHDTILPEVLADIALLKHGEIASITASRIINGNKVIDINLAWEDYFNNGFYSTADFDLFFSNSKELNSIKFTDKNNRNYNFQLSSGSITIIEGGGLGKSIVGEYHLDMTEKTSGLHSIFVGNFRLKNE